ncbi:helix-turn-helix transcriptional regulator [Aminobacter sp. MDW-2]|nr:helix-turn-helix transcriptional regulator [Aminobacter sp. MDW-2]
MADTGAEIDTSKEAIGRRLKAVRAVYGWPQTQMGTLLGITGQRWNTYEQGKSVPPPDILFKIWQLTGASTDYVLIGRKYGMPAELLTKLDDHLRTPATRKRA